MREGTIQNAMKLADLMDKSIQGQMVDNESIVYAVAYVVFSWYMQAARKDPNVNLHYMSTMCDELKRVVIDNVEEDLKENSDSPKIH